MKSVREDSSLYAIVSKSCSLQSLILINECMYIHTYIRTYIRTYIHTYIHLDDEMDKQSEKEFAELIQTVNVFVGQSLQVDHMTSLYQKVPTV